MDPTTISDHPTIPLPQRMSTTHRPSVSESGTYECRNRPLSARSLRHAGLTKLITAVHTPSHGTYGARRVHAELTLGYGIAVGHGCAEAPMRTIGMKGLPGNQRTRPQPQTSTARDLVDRKSPATNRTNCGSRTLPNVRHGCGNAHPLGISRRGGSHRDLAPQGRHRARRR